MQGKGGTINLDVSSGMGQLSPAAKLAAADTLANVQSPLGVGGAKGKGGAINLDVSSGMGRQLNDDYYAHTDGSKAFQQVSLKLLEPLAVQVLCQAYTSFMRGTSSVAKAELASQAVLQASPGLGKHIACSAL